MLIDLGEDRRDHVPGNTSGGIPGEFAGESDKANLTGVICGDSSAAIAFSQCRGCGKLRHINIGQLWIQEKVNSKELEIRKVPGEDIPSDMLTKHVQEKRRETYCRFITVGSRDRRASAGLVQQGGVTSEGGAKS